MKKSSPTSAIDHPVIKSFENNGLLYGSLLGALVGVLIAGPHFTEWSFAKIIAVVSLCSAVIGITGHLAVIVFMPLFSGDENYDVGLGDASGAEDSGHHAD